MAYIVDTWLHRWMQLHYLQPAHCEQALRRFVMRQIICRLLHNSCDLQGIPSLVYDVFLVVQACCYCVFVFLDVIYVRLCVADGPYHTGT